ncbi:MAG: hypothetical protein Q8N13_13355 [Acidovorax sp.]|nr:hypothetical protein [Acidovorax sp.]
MVNDVRKRHANFVYNVFSVLHTKCTNTERQRRNWGIACTALNAAWIAARTETAQTQRCAGGGWLYWASLLKQFFT